MSSSSKSLDSDRGAAQAEFKPPIIREATDGTVISWNDAAENLYGYSAVEMEGRSIGILYPEGLSARQQLVDRVLQGEELLKVHAVHRTKDGRNLNVTLSVIPEWDGNDSVVEYETIVGAYVEASRDESAFWESDAWIRGIVESAADAIVSIDSTGKLEYLNPAAQRLFGFTPEEIYGKGVEMLMPSPYRENHNEYIRNYLDTGDKKIIGLGREVVACRKDGSVFPIHLSVSEAIIDGRRIFTAIIHDIGERKRIELEKDRLLRDLDRRNKEITCLLRVGQLLRTAEFETSVFGKVVKLLEKAFSYQSITRVRIIYEDLTFVSSDFKEASWHISTDIAVGGQNRGRVEVYYVENRPEGDFGPFLQEEQSLLESVAMTLGEAIERQEAEAKVIQASKMASIGELAAGVGHEINNPINGIINCADIIMQNTKDDTKNRQFAELIRSEADRIAVIVQNLLTFSRQDREKHSPARLFDIVSVVLSLSAIKLEKSHIILKVDVPEDLPKVRCRSEQLQQVVMNLIINSMHALDQRFPDAHSDKILSVSAREFEIDGRRYLRLAVEDKGTGIAPAHLDRIFDPFFTTKGRDKGTGLGLSVSLGIVKDHGGTLHVESELDVGTRFHIELPLRPESADEQGFVG